MKMENVGYKNKDTDVGVSLDKNKMRYPSLNFSNKIPSSLNKKDVGDSCKFYVEGEVVSKSMDEYGESLTIDVHNISHSDKVVDKSEYDKMSDEEKNDADEKEVMEKDK